MPTKKQTFHYGYVALRDQQVVLGTLPHLTTKSASVSACSSPHRDVGLHEVVLCEVADPLLRDDDVRVEGHDLRADVLDVLLLHPEQCVPVLLLRHLHVRLGLQSTKPFNPLFATVLS